MPKRKLKRQLSLIQLVMLGTAGTIGAEIFVLTGTAANISGPSLVLALIIGGVLSYSIAINYGELATTYPVTGGAMTYVREAWGKGLLAFLVGSLDCLSSTFYAALSAVGFAYSLQVFIPTVPVVPTAIVLVISFIIINILGVNNVGNVQILLGGILLIILFLYILLGFILPAGFDLKTFIPQGKLFIHQDGWTNFGKLFQSIALVYVAYIGFEVIADDAEEIKNPNRNIPLGIIISLTFCILVYPLIALVTLGTIPWNDIGNSKTVLTDAAGLFLPGIGPLFMVIAGIIATVTTLNSAMLSATREAFTLSRVGMWPHFLSRLNRFRSPYAAILTIGAIICLVAAIGLVDFLSYISSSGYLFVLFWSNLSLIRLRNLYPDIKRTFRVPFYPVTVYIAVATCLLILLFTDLKALEFGIGLLAVLSIWYYLTPLFNSIGKSRERAAELAKDRILVPVANPETAEKLVYLAARLAQVSEESNICLFSVVKDDKRRFPIPASNLKGRLPSPLHRMLEKISREAFTRNVPVYSKVRAAPDIAQGILDEIENHPDIQLVLLGWPGPVDSIQYNQNPVRVLVQKAKTNLAVLLPRNFSKIHRVLVPVGGGLHSRLALRIAFEISEQENAHLTALHTYNPGLDIDEIEDEMNQLQDVIEEELGFIPVHINRRIVPAKSVPCGVIEETRRRNYDLLVIGASEEWGSKTRLFGSIDDWVMNDTGCSVLMVRNFEPKAIHWLRKSFKKISSDSDQ